MDLIAMIARFVGGPRDGRELTIPDRILNRGLEHAHLRVGPIDQPWTLQGEPQPGDAPFTEYRYISTASDGAAIFGVSLHPKPCC